jgi:hypothetical protein
MSELLFLHETFERLRKGHHLSPAEDEPAFTAVAANYDAYAQYFAPLGLTLVRDERDFFYFAPKRTDSPPETLAGIAVFSFILIDDAANAGKPIEEFVFATHFLISRLPHFSLDRYTALLRQVGIEKTAGLRPILKRMEGLGWVRFLGEEEFKFLRPFYRMFDKCLELSATAAQRSDESPSGNAE